MGKSIPPRNATKVRWLAGPLTPPGDFAWYYEQKDGIHLLVKHPGQPDFVEVTISWKKLRAALDRRGTA